MKRALPWGAALLALTIASAAGGLVAQTSPPASPDSVKADACALLTRTDVAAVQSDTVRNMQASEQRGGDLRLLQCFYTTTRFAKSVTVVLAIGPQGLSNSPAEYWRKQFSRAKQEGDDKDGEPPHVKPAASSAPTAGEVGEQEEERESGPPLRVDGLGDDAYWVGNNISSTLYVLAGDKFLRISIGGNDDRETKLKKSIDLARRALSRLSKETGLGF